MKIYRYLPTAALALSVLLFVPTDAHAAQPPVKLPPGATVTQTLKTRDLTLWQVTMPGSPESFAGIGRVRLPANAVGRGFRDYIGNLERSYEQSFASYGLQALVTIRKKTYVISGSVDGLPGGDSYSFYAKGALGSRRFLHYGYVWSAKDNADGVALLNAVRGLKAPK